MLLTHNHIHYHSSPPEDGDPTYRKFTYSAVYDEQMLTEQRVVWCHSMLDFLTLLNAWNRNGCRWRYFTNEV